MTDFNAAEFDAVAYLNDPAWASSNYGTGRMAELMARLGNPQERLRYVHVAGTNGKGSTCAYLDAVLRAAGYKVGLYTSPYIEAFEERIRVDGENIPAEDLLSLTLQVREAAEAIAEESRAAVAAGADPAEVHGHPTAFELMTAVAFLYYAQQDCDIVVLEVGLGGRLDATNIIPAPEVAVIVRLGIDHVEILGDTLAAIAGEKAGIIKPGCTVVSWPQEPEADEVLRRVADAAGVEFRTPDFAELEIMSCVLDPASAEVPLRKFTYKGAAYATRLLGQYQPMNATVALEAIAALTEKGWDITPKSVAAGMTACTWPGRFEVIGTRPLRIVDGGHNPQGAEALATSLSDVLPEVKPIFVMGILADKDYKYMVRTLAPFGSAFFCVTPPTPRALPAHALADELRAVLPADAEIPVTACESFAEAGNMAKDMAAAWAQLDAPAVIVATGSLYSVADEKAALR